MRKKTTLEVGEREEVKETPTPDVDASTCPTRFMSVACKEHEKTWKVVRGSNPQEREKGLGFRKVNKVVKL